MSGVIFLATFVNDPTRTDPSPTALLIGLAVVLAGFALLAWWTRRRADL